DAGRDEALMEMERFLGHRAQRRLVTLPAERTNDQVGVDALDAAVVDGAVGLGRDVSEPDTFRRERLLDPVTFHLCPRARGVGLPPQLGAHLACQARDRPEAEDLRGVALVRAAGLRTVSAHERVLRLRAGAVGSSLRVTAEAAERIGPAGRAQVDA